ncbi:hypothetical protein, partial [Nitrosomonas sp.]|uniref:hypothetical protein n=1 Tax=Nitrosomonas sp. TaxID=42353 RepID=UPI00374DDC67
RLFNLRLTEILQQPQNLNIFLATAPLHADFQQSTQTIKCFRQYPTKTYTTNKQFTHYPLSKIICY